MAKATPKPKPDKELCTTNRETLSAFFGVSTVTMRKWQGMNGFPDKGAGGYSLSRIAQWIIGYFRDRANPRASNVDDRLKLARAQREELKLAREREEVIELDILDRAMRRYLTSARIILDGLPDSILLLIPEGLQQALRPVVQQKVNEALGSLQRIPASWQAAPEEGS